MNDQNLLTQETAAGNLQISKKKSCKELYMIYNRNHGKKGSFTVGWELISRLYTSLESHGYIIPNLDQKTKHRIRPDRSVQPAFVEFMKTRYVDLTHVFEYGKLIDEDEPMEVRVMHFKNQYLIDFIEFFEDVWLPKTAPGYFKTRDKLALKYLPCLLDDPKILKNR